MFRKLFGLIVASPPRVLVLGFAAIVLSGASLLMMPFAHTKSAAPQFIDTLFTATSATCVTGLIVEDTGTYWTTAGQWIILAMIQVGGLGFMTMATLFAIVLKRRISLRERLVLQEAFNQTSIEGIIRLVRKVVIYALTIELSGALLFTSRFMFDMPFGKAVHYGVFHAVSFFNNAGFDIMGNYRSLTEYVGDPVINIVTMLLIVLGGLGFVVLADLVDIRNPKRKLSLHSKVVLSMTSILIVVGAAVIFIFEYTNPGTLGPLPFGQKVLAAFTQSVSPRTAGVNTVDLASLRQATEFFMVILMFIGASPGSTGGGIKTTTFTALIGAVIAMIRGKEDIVLFKNRLAQERVHKALTVTLFAFGIVILATMILSTTENAAFLKILFEVTSAFGTVGLTLGLTAHLTLAGKIIIIIMMFIGRLGPLTLTYALGPRKERQLYRNAEGKIIIG
ncbi:TrkH family potassium uptake protein [Cohnella endophytica]|uniref:TrkH family potassium uptake protein n=1 Tax=Cohnella endophytica TaxID=2419778 RepID=UPI001F3909BD|nr:TrkH family potassium uptake protein [Cohnella endophytica]